jgi:hypothetical protein
MQIAVLRTIRSIRINVCRPPSPLGFSRKVENKCDQARPTPRTLETGGELRQRHGARASIPSAEVRVITVGAWPNGFHAVATAEGAPRGDALAELPRIADSLYHRTEIEHSVRGVDTFKIATRKETYMEVEGEPAHGVVADRWYTRRRRLYRRPGNSGDDWPA